MNPSRNKLYGVISGDIVSSTSVTGLRNILISSLLEQTFSKTQAVFPNAFPLPIDIFSGDSWQLLIAEPAKSLRIGIYYRATLITEGVDTRMAIAVGEIDSLPSERVSTGQGEAFSISGKALAELVKSKERRLKISLPHTPSARLTDPIANIIDMLISKWSPGQATAVLGKLEGLTQEEIADSWRPKPITQQAVGKHLHGAEWSSLLELIDAIENIIAETV